MAPEQALPLQFVNLGQDAPALGADQRRSVRSHAMLGFMREQRQRRIGSRQQARFHALAPHRSSLAADDKENEDETGGGSLTTTQAATTRAFKQRYDKLIDLDYDSNSDSPSLPSLFPAVSPSKLDPFNQTSIAFEPYMDNAIYFANYFFPRLLYPQMLSDKFSIVKKDHFALLHVAVKDKCVMNAMLAVSIFLSQGPARNRQDIQHGLQHRGKALEMIRTVLGDNREYEVQFLIMAITWLVPIEVFLGNLEAHNAHMQALRRLVIEAGGMECLDPMRYYILEADYRSSTIFDTDSVFGFHELGVPLSSTRYLRLPNLSDSSIYEVIAEIQLLQEFIDNHHKPKSQSEVVQSSRMFLDVRCLIHHTLLDLKNICSGPNKCLRYALLIYVNLAFRAYLAYNVVWVNLAKRLRDALLEMNRDTFKGKEQILLWMLFVPCVPLRKMSVEMRKWFFGAAQALCESLRLTTWEQVLAALRKLIRPAESIETEFERIWAEIQLLGSLKTVMKESLAHSLDEPSGTESSSGFTSDIPVD